MKNFIFCLSTLSAVFLMSCGGTEDENQIDCSASALSLSKKSSTDASCIPDGSLEVQATGGTGDLLFSLNQGAGQTSGKFENLDAGTYSVKVSDENGCSNTLQVIVGSSANTVSISNVAPTHSQGCNSSNGTITVTASGGSGSLSYQLGDGSFQSSNVFSNLSADDYTVTVKDEESCTQSSSVTIESITTVSITDVGLSESGGCNSSNGTITVTASGTGTLSYKLDDGAFQSSNIFENLVANEYVVTVMDETCSKSESVHLKSGTSLSTDIMPIIDSKCSIASCHRAGTGLSDFTVKSKVIAKKTAIKNKTQDGSMPKNGSLTQNQKDLIACWVDDGGLDN